jgi:hypothetical protein
MSVRLGIDQTGRIKAENPASIKGKSSLPLLPSRARASSHCHRSANGPPFAAATHAGNWKPPQKLMATIERKARKGKK